MSANEIAKNGREKRVNLKVCPMRKTVTKGFLVVEADTFGECIGEACAWFHPKAQICAILLASDILEFIGERMEAR